MIASAAAAAAQDEEDGAMPEVAAACRIVDMVTGSDGGGRAGGSESSSSQGNLEMRVSSLRAHFARVLLSSSRSPAAAVAVLFLPCRCRAADDAPAAAAVAASSSPPRDVSSFSAHSQSLLLGKSLIYFSRGLYVLVVGPLCLPPCLCLASSFRDGCFARLPAR